MNLFKSFYLSFFSVLTTTLIRFYILLYFPNKISISEYGKVVYFIWLVDFLVIISQLGTINARYKLKSLNNRFHIITRLDLVSIILILLVFIITSLFDFKISVLFLFTSLFSFVRSIFQSNLDFAILLIFDLIYAVSIILLSFFWDYTNWNLYYLFLIINIILFLFSLCNKSIIVTFTNLYNSLFLGTYKINIIIFHEIKYFAMISILGSFVWNRGELFFLKKYSSLDALSLFSISILVISIFQNLVTLFSSSILPIIYKIKNVDLEFIFSTILEFIFIFIIPLSFFIFFNSNNIIIQLYGKKYIEAIFGFKYFTILGILIPFTLINSIIYKNNRVNVSFYSSIIVFIFSIIINYFTIPVFGFKGAIISKFIINSFVYLHLLFLLYSYCNFKFSFFKSLFLKLLIIIIFSFCFFYIQNLFFINIYLSFLILICIYLFFTKHIYNCIKIFYQYVLF